MRNAARLARRIQAPMRPLPVGRALLGNLTQLYFCRHFIAAMFAISPFRYDEKVVVAKNATTT